MSTKFHLIGSKSNVEAYKDEAAGRVWGVWHPGQLPMEEEQEGLGEVDVDGFIQDVQSQMPPPEDDDDIVGDFFTEGKSLNFRKERIGSLSLRLPPLPEGFNARPVLRLSKKGEAFFDSSSKGRRRRCRRCTWRGDSKKNSHLSAPFRFKN